MRALLFKDFVSGKSVYLSIFAIVAVVGGGAISQGRLIFIPFVFVFLPIILNATSFGTEEQVDFAKFVFTAPISRNTYVLSKYVFAFMLSLLALISSLLIFYKDFQSLEIAFIVAVTAFALPVILSSIQIPLLIKYGAERGRIIMVIMYFFLFGISSLIGEKYEEIIKSIQMQSQSHPFLAAGVLFLAAMFIFCISVSVCTSIVKNKEY